jgi:hypothetical protein
VKGGTIATVLVEAEEAVEPPISVSHVQWLDMHDWAARLADNSEAGEQWYRSSLDKILALLADPKTQRFAGEIAELENTLKPISQEANIGALIDGFIGREWLKSKLDNWCKNDRNSRLFWISGAPGAGKSAFAAWLAHLGRIKRYCVESLPLQHRRAPRPGARPSDCCIPDCNPPARLSSPVAGPP